MEAAARSCRTGWMRVADVYFTPWRISGRRVGPPWHHFTVGVHHLYVHCWGLGLLEACYGSDQSGFHMVSLWFCSHSDANSPTQHLKMTSASAAGLVSLLHRQHGEVSGGHLGPVLEPPSGGKMATERWERTGWCACILWLCASAKRRKTLGSLMMLNDV
jgi:hypothetical protein